jgi:WD40 repeat protein
VLTCLNFSPSGRRLAAVGYDGIVTLIDPLTGQEVLALRGLIPQRPAEKASDSQVVFSPDGHKIAVNTWKGSVCIFDAEPLADSAANSPP